MGNGSTAGSSGGSKRDCGHLDEDAECLEDPVHCGDARHQHEAHATTPTAEPPGAADAAKAPAGETSQT